MILHVVDVAIVGSAVGGAGIWLLRRWLSPAQPGCGSCGTTKTELVQLRRSLARDRRLP